MGRRMRAALQRHVRVAVWDRDERADARARSLRRSSRCTTAASADVSCSDRKSRRMLAHRACCRAARRGGAASSISRSRTSSPSAHCFEGVRLLPAGHVPDARARRAARGELRRATGTSTSRSPSAPLRSTRVPRGARSPVSPGVDRQLVSDVDVGCYLSGGMDSGSITAVAATRLPELKTFTCGFDLRSASGLELGFDERENAESCPMCSRPSTMKWC